MSSVVASNVSSLLPYDILFVGVNQTTPPDSSPKMSSTKLNPSQPLTDAAHLRAESNLHSTNVPKAGTNLLQRVDFSTLDTILKIWMNVSLDKMNYSQGATKGRLEDNHFSMDMMRCSLNPTKSLKKNQHISHLHSPNCRVYSLQDVSKIVRAFVQVRNKDADLDIITMVINPLNIEDRNVKNFLLKSTEDLSRQRNQAKIIAIPLSGDIELFQERGYVTGPGTFEMSKTL